MHNIFTYLTKFILITICIAHVHSYILSYKYANELSTINKKMNGKLVETYKNMSSDLSNFTNELKKILEISKSYTNLAKFVSNPIYAFKLVKLLTMDFEKLQSSFTRRHKLEFLQVVEEAITSYKLIFPTDQDLRGVCSAIIRLQEIYKLDENLITSGQFQKYWNGSLTVDDLVLLKECFRYQKPFSLYDWMTSEIKEDEDSDLDLILKEYYYVLHAYYNVINKVIHYNNTMRKHDIFCKM